MSDKPQARAGIKSTEAQVFGSDAAQAQPSANSLDSNLLNPDPQPVASTPGDLLIVTGFSEDGINVDEGVTITDEQRVRAIIEALHCHVGVLRGLIARREGEFSTNPSSLAFELQALKKGKLRAETILAELTPSA